MAILPPLPRIHPEVERRIHAGLEAEREIEEKAQEGNEFVRLSSAGRCQREQWARLNGIADQKPPAGRTLMIFDVGHAVEAKVVRWLRLGGYEVLDVDEDGEQFEVVFPGGVGVGHIDGMIRWGHGRDSEWRLLEVKTAKASKFEELVKLGTYAAWNPQYAAQVQAYMGASVEPDSKIHPLRDCLVLVVCKDDSRIWPEMIRFDADEYTAIRDKLELVVGSEIIVPRPPEGKSQYCKACKWCSVNAWCWSPLAEVTFDN